MRTKKFKLLMAFILILALCFTFIACTPVDDDDDEDGAPEVSELVDEMVEKLATDLTISNARRLNIDISGAVTLEELNGESPLFWKYELIAKGNIALTANAKETDSNFRIELNSYTKEGVKATLFSLLYESEVDDSNKYTGSYFYLTLPGKETPLKINAVSLLKLIPGSDEALEEPISISDYLGIGMAVLAKTGEKVGEDSYKFTTDMSMIWDMVNQFLIPMLDDPNALNNLIPGLGIDLSQILNEAIPVLFEGLTYKSTDESGAEINKPVATIKDLLSYVEQNLPEIDFDLNFNFNGNTFSGATIVANYAPKDVENPTHKCTVDLYTATIGAGKYIAYDDGYSLTAQQRKAMAANSNLLTFSVDGKMNFINSKGVVTNYSIDIEADVNPLILVDGFNIGKLANIGKLSLTVTNDATGDTLLTLYCNGADKELIVSYQSPAGYIIIKNVCIGGEFTFEALGGIINALTPATETPAPDGGTSGGTTGDEEAGQDVAGKIIKEVFKRLDFSSLSTKGLVINDVKGIIDVIFKNIDLGLGSSTDLLIGALHGAIFNSAESVEIGIKEGGFRYGECNIIDKTQIVLPGHSESNNTYGSLLDDTKTVKSPDIQTEYEYGENFKINERGGSGNEAKHTFTLNGKNRNNKDATYSAVYYGQTGFDATKPGTQTVTVYYGINSGLSSLLTNSLLAGALGGLSQWLPLFGAHMMTVDVTVYPKVEVENVALIIDGSTTIFTDKSIADSLNATIRYKDPNGNIREAKVTNDMISCKKPVIANGKFLYLGKYTLDINYKGIKISQNVTVNEIVVTQESVKAKVSTKAVDQGVFKMKTYTESGEIKILDLDSVKAISAHAMDGTLEPELLDSEGNILGYYSYRAKAFYVMLEYTLNGTKGTFNMYFNGNDALDITNISSISNYPQKMATNTEITDIGYGYLGYVSTKDANNKTQNYYPVFSVEQNKMVLIKGNDTTPDWAPNFETKIKFAKTHEYDAATKAYVELDTPEAWFELSADKLTLEVGKYSVKYEYGPLFSYGNLEVAPYVTYKDYSDYASSITSGISLNIDARKLTGAGNGTKDVSIRWDATSASYKLYLSYKDGSTTKYKVVDENEAKLVYTAEMYKDGEWVAPEFATADGKFSKNADSKYYAYKFNATITIGDLVFTSEFVLNTKQAPQA